MLEGVSKTALVTLRARADEHAKKKRMFADPWAVEWLAAIGWPGELDRYYSGWIQAKNAIRTAQIDGWVSSCIERFAVTTVVELACGLSSRRQRLGFEGRWIDLDLPEVIELRRSIGAEGEALAQSVLDESWIDAVTDPERTLVIAEGLFYYLPRGEVERLFIAMREQLAGAVFVFDVIGALDLEAARGYSRRLDAPIHWAIDPPFERAMLDFGLAPIAGLEPEVLLQDGLQRVFAPLRPLMAAMAKVRFFRDRRSGTMIGVLAPPDG